MRNRNLVYFVSKLLLALLVTFIGVIIYPEGSSPSGYRIITAVLGMVLSVGGIFSMVLIIVSNFFIPEEKDRSVMVGVASLHIAGRA